MREIPVHSLHNDGALLVVSHDGHLISNVADALWHVEDGTVSVFAGDFTAYKSQVLKARG